MPSQRFTGPESLDVLADQCAAALINEPKHTFVYPESCSPEHWPVDEIKRLNRELLSSLRHRANVYALFVRSKSPDAKWQIRYVGQRKARELRERISQHLIQKNERTGSQLERVKAAVCEGCEVGISYITVEPESLRMFVEESIISKHRKRLPWNTHG